ncbi:MAG: DUF4381 domain-containing protein [Gammaproteobacteria bacterium]|nr:DUF4381 domain-containing protein [Gammaproteobacteria bacterium]
MDNTLDNLRDITLPTAVSWWPPALGWWLLALILIIVIILSTYWLKTRLYRTSTLSLAQQELNNIMLKYNDDHNSTTLMSQLSILLKRYALLCFPEENIAGLNGKKWQDFIIRHGPDIKDIDAEKIAEQLTTSPYKKFENTDSDTKKIITYFNNWLKYTHANSKHKFQYKKKKRND